MLDSSVTQALRQSKSSKEIPDFSSGPVSNHLSNSTYIAWIRAFISYFFLRASIMLFTLRLLPFNKKFARRVIYVAFGLNFAITLIACVCYGVKCTPFRAAYAEVPGSTCRSNQMLIASQIVNGVLACVIDVATALIPAFLLWDLQMKRKTKICLNIIFLLGLFTAALSIARAATTTSTTYGDDLTCKQPLPSEHSPYPVHRLTRRHRHLRHPRRHVRRRRENGHLLRLLPHAPPIRHLRPPHALLPPHRHARHPEPRLHRHAKARQAPRHLLVPEADAE